MNFTSIRLVFGVSLLFLMGSAFAQYSEAPNLAERVAAGELPPIEERLPQNPLVVEPLERVGDYGGTWRSVLVGGVDFPWLARTIGYENLVRVDPEWTEVIPNIAESFEVNEEATAYTFNLREGMRWSDGEPFTANDIMFWYEDVLMNNEITAAVPGWLISAGEPVVVEKVDDYTVVFSFSEPNGLFLQHLASGSGHLPTVYPRHYLEQFHIDYNPEGIDALVQEAGADDWVNLFQMRGHTMTGYDARWFNPDLPTLLAWQVLTPYGQGTRMIAERNPYYFKVDTAGNQLPYLDRIAYDLMEDAQVFLLRVLAGEIELTTDRHVGTAENRPVIFDNQERGDYRIYTLVPSGQNTMALALNLTHRDPVKKEIFQNRDFRIGLSHAINRQELIDLVFVGQGEPWQPAPRRQAPFYNEQLATQYTEHDIDLANEHLDLAGYTERDTQGYRLGPDGNRITITIETFDSQTWVDMLELIQGYWREVGIDAQVRVIDRSLLVTRVDSNEHDAMVWFGGGGLLDHLLQMRWVFPSAGNADNGFAVAWGNWYTGADGPSEEPPAEVRRQMELYDQLVTTGDEARQLELAREILEIAAEQFYVMGISLPADAYGTARNNFRNVPDMMFQTAGAYNHPAPTNPEQYFLEGGGQ